MAYRDELEAALLRIAQLEARLEAPGGGPVQDMPEPLITREDLVLLRRSLYEARVEAAEERRQRARVEELLRSRDTAPPLEWRAGTMEPGARSPVDAEVARERNALRQQLRIRESEVESLQEQVRVLREASSTLRGELDLARMRVQMLALRGTPRPDGSASAFPSAADVAAFRDRFCPAALGSLTAEGVATRLRELALLVASSAFGTGRAPSLGPAIDVLRHAGHPLREEGPGCFASDPWHPDGCLRVELGRTLRLDWQRPNTHPLRVEIDPVHGLREVSGG